MRKGAYSERSREREALIRPLTRGATDWLMPIVKTPKPPPLPKDVREAKLAAALRANLKRRKGAVAAKPGGET